MKAFVSIVNSSLILLKPADRSYGPINKPPQKWQFIAFLVNCISIFYCSSLFGSSQSWSNDARRWDWVPAMNLITSLQMRQSSGFDLANLAVLNRCSDKDMQNVWRGYTILQARLLWCHSHKRFDVEFEEHEVTLVYLF